MENSTWRDDQNTHRRRTTIINVASSNTAEDPVRADDVVMRQAVSGVELIFRVVAEELDGIRFRLREKGERMRAFIGNRIPIQQALISLTRRLAQLFGPVIMSNESSLFEGDAAMIFNEIPLQIERRSTKYTFNDLANVLLKDSDEKDGVILAYTIRCPAWKILPIREKVEHISDGMNDFQLFNKPIAMAMTMDEEDEQMSITSAHTTVTESSELKAVRAQLAMLSRQMELLINSNMAGTSQSRMETSEESSPFVSEDEGKGASLCSPAMSKKKLSRPQCGLMRSPHPHRAAQSPALPKVSPPLGPPPPPPPSNLSTVGSGSAPPAPPPPPCDFYSKQSDSISRKASCESQDSVAAVDENRSPSRGGGDATREPVVRPSVFDLRTVQLKKTAEQRSPGGTPVHRASRLTSTQDMHMDQGNYLAAALREKFRTANTSFSEHEDDNTSSWED